MYKKMIVVSLVILLSGCINKNLFSYTHKVYGLGNKDNPNFVRDKEECHKTVYVNGVLIDGVRVTDPVEIEKYQKEYTEILIADFQRALKQNVGNAAYAGSTAAAAVTTGNTSNLNRNSKAATMAPPPEKYKDLERLRGEAIDCLASKGWKQITH